MAHGPVVHASTPPDMQPGVQELRRVAERRSLRGDPRDSRSSIQMRAQRLADSRSPIGAARALGEREGQDRGINEAVDEQAAGVDVVDRVAEDIAVEIGVAASEIDRARLVTWPKEAGNVVAVTGETIGSLTSPHVPRDAPRGQPAASMCWRARVRTSLSGH